MPRKADQKNHQPIEPEFDLIARYFSPLAGPEGLGLLDDAALFDCPQDQQLVITKDMLVETVHFRSEDSAEDIAQKALAVNLSDLAACGARPYLYFLGLGLTPDRGPAWFTAFARGLKEAQNCYGIKLAGGDTVAAGERLVLSITAVGLVARGAMLQRKGAVVGDEIWVSGSLGEAALGLHLLGGQITTDPKSAAIWKKRYLRPEPRLALGEALRGIASAAADISDGLLADLGHICKASQVSATLYQQALLLTKAEECLFAERPDLQYLPFNGGDDYELVFTAAPNKRDDIEKLAKSLALPLMRIGYIKARTKETTSKHDICLLNPRGDVINIDQKGYSHHI